MFWALGTGNGSSRSQPREDTEEHWLFLPEECVHDNLSTRAETVSFARGGVCTQWLKARQPFGGELEPQSDPPHWLWLMLPSVHSLRIAHTAKIHWKILRQHSFCEPRQLQLPDHISPRWHSKSHLRYDLFAQQGGIALVRDALLGRLRTLIAL